MPALLILGDPRGGTGGGTLAFTMVVFFFSGGIVGVTELPIFSPDLVPVWMPPLPPPLDVVVVVDAAYTLDAVSVSTAREEG